MVSKWPDSVRRSWSGLGAALRLGWATKLRRAQRLEDALFSARKGLRLLNTPYVRRDQGIGGALLVTLTLLVEHLAYELREPGAGARELRDSIEFLQSANERDLRASVLFLQSTGLAKLPAPSDLRAVKRPVVFLKEELSPYFERRLRETAARGQ